MIPEKDKGCVVSDFFVDLTALKKPLYEFHCFDGRTAIGVRVAVLKFIRTIFAFVSVREVSIDSQHRQVECLIILLIGQDFIFCNLEEIAIFKAPVDIVILF